jgi:hypothetical protein
MRLERHRFLVSTVIAFVFTAVGGSIQAAAQSIATSTSGDWRRNAVSVA